MESILQNTDSIRLNYLFDNSNEMKFSLKNSQKINLIVYNTLGQQVKELLVNLLPAGNYKIAWDGKDEQGNKAASGIYFYLLQTNSSNFVKKMVLN